MGVLADAALDEPERELLDRFVAALEQAYGDDLDAVWLHGSRARGERPHDEPDIDVLGVTRSERDDTTLIATLWRILSDMATRGSS
jgi:predicted nucleotidyltransferase